MKKVLIGTSALVAAGFIAAGPAAAAEKIKLGLGGFQNVWAGFAEQDSAFANGAEYGDFDVKSNTEIFIKGSTKLDNGLTVGAHVEMEADNDDGTVDHSYAYVSSAEMGTLYLGATSGAFDRLTVNAPSAAFDGNTTGGQEGPRQWVVAPGAGHSAQAFVHADAGDSNRISYISPSFSGFQVGASFVPDTAINQTTPAYNGGDDSQWHAAARYTGTFDGVGLKIGAGFISQDDETNPASSGSGYDRWRANASLSYAGFTFGGGYTDTDQDSSAGNHGDAWNLGLMYATGPYKISANYMKSDMAGTVNTTAGSEGNDEYTYYGINGSYNMGPGVDVKASISSVEYDDETTTVTNSNDGWFAAAGLNLSF